MIYLKLEGVRQTTKDALVINVLKQLKKLYNDSIELVYSKVTPILRTLVHGHGYTCRVSKEYDMVLEITGLSAKSYPSLYTDSIKPKYVLSTRDEQLYQAFTKIESDDFINDKDALHVFTYIQLQTLNGNAL